MTKKTARHAQALSVREAAEILGVCEQTVRKAARQGRIPALRVLKRVLIPRAGLDRLLGNRAPTPNDAGDRASN